MTSKTTNTLLGKVETLEPYGGAIIIKHNGVIILEAKDIDTRSNDMVEAKKIVEEVQTTSVPSLPG